MFLIGQRLCLLASKICTSSQAFEHARRLQPKTLRPFETVLQDAQAITIDLPLLCLKWSAAKIRTLEEHARILGLSFDMDISKPEAQAWPRRVKQRSHKMSSEGE